MNLVVPGVGPELHDGRDDLGGDLREFGDERRGERLLDLRLVLLEAAGAADLEKVRPFSDIALLCRERGTSPKERTATSRFA